MDENRAGDSPTELADIMYVPALSTDKSENVAIPLTDGMVVVPDTVPDPPLTPTVTENEPTVTRLPPASLTETTGCVERREPPEPPLGFVLYESLVAAPTTNVFKARPDH